MIALLLKEIHDTKETEYYKQFSEKIFTTNPNINFLSFEELKNQNILQKLLEKHKIQGILVLEKNEKIKLLKLEDFTNRSDYICVSDKNWVNKELRVFSNNIKKTAEQCQQIVVSTDKKIDNPVLPFELNFLKDIYKKNDFAKFVLESEKWIFHNLNITSKQVMLRYYCGLVYHFKLKNTKKALEHLGVSIFLMPSMPELWCAWGDILLDIKQYEKAKNIYKNANIVKKHRNIYDRFPLWIKKNEDYAENMYRLVSDTLQGIKIIKSVDNF